MKNGDIHASSQVQNEELQVGALRIALTTCDNIFEPGGVSTSITRIARGLSTHYNARIDILMLKSDQHAEFNPRGKNGITQLHQRVDKVTVYQLAPWTGRQMPRSGVSNADYCWFHQGSEPYPRAVSILSLFLQLYSWQSVPGSIDSRLH